MFASTAEFVLTGDKKIEKQMKAAINLIINGFSFKPVAFRMLDDGRAVFYDYLHDKEKYSDIILISKENQNEEFLTSLVNLYLASDKYRQAIYNIPRFEGDGSYYEGWRMSLDNTTEIDKIIVEPCWAFYHK